MRQKNIRGIAIDGIDTVEVAIKIGTTLTVERKKVTQNIPRIVVGIAKDEDAYTIGTTFNVENKTKAEVRMMELKLRRK